LSPWEPAAAHGKPDAPELIADVYRRRQALCGVGRAPSRVIMNPEQYRAIQTYHAMLGDVPDGAVDYIARYRLFDLEICIEQVDELRVE
jgi:hypothetical protein